MPWFRFLSGERPYAEKATGAAQSARSRTKDVVSFEVIDWIGADDADATLLLMQSLSGTRYGPVSDLAIARSRKGVPDEDFIRWFNHYGH